MLDIISKRKYTFKISLLLVALSIFALASWGLNFGIDFKGGTLMEVEFQKDEIPQPEEITSKLSDLSLNSLIVQKSEDKSYILRYVQSDEAINQEVLKKLKQLDENIIEQRVDFIGSSVSNQIKKNAILALVVAIIAILCYIAYAFRKVSYPVSSWYYGVGAVIALFHDVLITLGVFAVLGHFLNVEVDISFVAAILTILGFSVHDTIVVYDRTRENLTRSNNKEDFEQVVNRSLNETLARSINTSLTVVIVLVAIILFGGESIKFFSIALLIGIIFGTYSSVYIASALLVVFYEKKFSK